MSIKRIGLTILFFSFTSFFLIQATSIPVNITCQEAYPVKSEAEFLKSTVSYKDIGRFMSAFRPLDLSQLELSSRPDNIYWYRFTLSNHTHERLYAMLGLVGHSRAILYEWDGHNAIALGTGGLDIPRKDLFLPNTRPIFRLNLSGTEPKTYLLRTERLWVRDMGLVIYPEYALLSSVESYSLLLGLVVGILFCALLFQICFYFLSRQIDYLWLAGQLFFGLVYTLVGNGFLSLYISLPTGLSPTLVYLVCICLTGFLSLQFQQTFLQLDVHGNAFIRKGYRVFQVGYIGFIGIAVWGKAEWFDWQSPFTGLVAAFCLYATCIVYRQGYKLALYFLIIQLLPALFIPLLVFQQQGQIGGIGNTLFLVASLQSILFSYSTLLK